MRKVILAALFAVYANAQAPANTPQKKVLTPEQLAYQQAEKDHYANLERLGGATIAAYKAELVREKTPLCADTQSTYEINMCLSKEIKVTDANYKAFITALRAI